MDRLRRRGIRALWTADCSATVELARLEGPELGQVTTTWARRVGLTGSGPWCVSDPCVRIALYEYCLVRGTVFDIYRWVNLRALASVWHALLVPPGVRHEWGAVLRAARLLPA